MALEIALAVAVVVAEIGLAAAVVAVEIALLLCELSAVVALMQQRLKQLTNLHSSAVEERVAMEVAEERLASFHRHPALPLGIAAVSVAAVLMRWHIPPWG